MNKIKFVILLLVVFMLFSCASAPKSWDSFSGKMYLKIFKTTCIKSAESGAAGSGHSEEAKKFFESACDCVVKQIPILYPNPSDMPSNLKDEPEWIEASEMCMEKHNPKK